MTTSPVIVGPDRHGRRPSFSHFSPNDPLPDSRADILAWLVSQRRTQIVEAALGFAQISAGSDQLRRPGRRAPDRLAGDVLAAFEATADELHALAKEFGYEPTTDLLAAAACRVVLAHAIIGTVEDLLEGDRLTQHRGDHPLRSARTLLQVGAIAHAIDTLDMDAKDSAQRALAMLKLATEDMDPDVAGRVEQHVNDLERRLSGRP